MQKPLLSIGMIFKNEIRCLERCMKSLQPLREAIPCELVMADTGSDDGSREVAERYADILFDFPWIKDFSAARNAVMDRCSGVWYLSIDADEWLDRNIDELAAFLKADLPFDWASLYIYNYQTPELEDGGQYADFIAVRLARMETEPRFEGVIHEHWDIENSRSRTTRLLPKTILHHDGYLNVDKERALAKSKRNMELLKIKLEQDPADIRTLLQCAECAAGEESLRYVSQALETGAPDSKDWKNYGPPLLRRAVQVANDAGLPETEDWIERAVEEFPDSIFIRVDVACCAFSWYLQKKDYERCIRYGEMYLEGVKDRFTRLSVSFELQYGIVSFCTPPWEKQLRIYLADAYQRAGRTEAAVHMLSAMDEAAFHEADVRNFIKALRYIHSSSSADTAPLLERLWKRVNSGSDTGEELRNVFIQTASEAFTPFYCQNERERDGFRRPAYTLFLPLAGQCETGTAAAVLESEDRAELAELLGTVKRWEEFPILALEHALAQGAGFPLPGKALKVEEMDGLIARMAREDGPLTGLAILAADEAEAKDWQALAWARGLALAAVRTCGWSGAKQGMELSRAFAKMEGAFLPRYYAAELLCDENILLLPPLHRFGWYCNRAFRALDAGNPAEYVRLLRSGLETCPEMKDMAEFLLKQLEESRRVSVTPELLSLAEQVRMLLSMYPADDPAVEALKQSAAYQKVAHLIEGPDLGVYGGLPQ